MTIESFIAFSGAMTLLAVTPGPGVFASVAQALSGGFRSSLSVISGIILGDILFLMLAVYGLSSVAALLGDLFFAVRLLGGAYLVWLGWRMWTAKPAVFSPPHTAGRRTGGRRFVAGLLITLGNPKVILFYVGFLPTFFDLTGLTSTDVAAGAVAVAVILWVVLGTYAYCASRARRLFSGTRAVRRLNRAAGTVMIGTGFVIATG